MSLSIVGRNSPLRWLVVALGLPGALAWPRSSLAEDEKKPAENTAPGYLPGYRQAMGLGLSPYAPQAPGMPAGLTVPFSAPAPADDWAFNFCGYMRSEEHTSELQSLTNLVC